MGVGPPDRTLELTTQPAKHRVADAGRPGHEHEPTLRRTDQQRPTLISDMARREDHLASRQPDWPAAVASRGLAHLSRSGTRNASHTACHTTLTSSPSASACLTVLLPSADRT